MHIIHQQDGCFCKVALSLAVAAVTILVAACDDRSKSSPASISGQDDAAKIHDALTFKIAGNPGPAERIQFPGFSIVAPQGEHWIERRLPDPPSNYAGFVPRLMFVKILPQTGAGPHTVIAGVTVALVLDQAERVSMITSPRQYMEFRMKYNVESTKLGSGRMRAISVEAKYDDTLGNCYRYDIVFEDRGVYGFPNTAFILDLHGYECADPAAKSIVKIEYSQRRPPEVTAFDLSGEGEDYLKSLKFAEPQG